METAEFLTLLRKRVDALCPAGVQVEVTEIDSGMGVLVPRHHRLLHVAAAALEAEWGITPILMRSGGSIPVGELFQRLLGAPIVFMGVGLPDDNIHAPNEKLHLPNFRRLIRQTIRFLLALSYDAAPLPSV